MLRFRTIGRKERVLKALIGMKKEAFLLLLKRFKEAYSEAEAKHHEEQARQRKPGGGRKPTLSTAADKLLFILVYIKVYPTQDVQGLMFDMSQSTVCEWVRRLFPVIQAALGKDVYLPVRPSVRTMEELYLRCPELRYIIDGTERPVRRPKDTAQQKERYSGKKKRHSVKNTIISDPSTKKVILLGKTQPGKMHDKKMAEEDDLKFPEGSYLLKDSGYQGYEPNGVSCLAPKKKPRGGELTPEEKTENKRISRLRIPVEHSIGGVKFFGIVGGQFRNRRKGFDDMSMEVSCGLHNLRIDCSIAKAA